VVPPVDVPVVVPPVVVPVVVPPPVDDEPSAEPDGFAKAVLDGKADTSFWQEVIDSEAINTRAHTMKAIRLCPRPGLIIVVKLIMPFER
jgi:hypothetical protein